MIIAGNRSKKIITILIAACITFAMLFAAAPTKTYAASTPNLTAAQKQFSVNKDRIYTAKNPNAIETQLAKAGAVATSKNPAIVYAPAGTYKMPKKLTVPKNVIFVAEDKSVFNAGTNVNFTQFFMVQGSLYGGTYNCANKANYGLRFDNIKFDGNKNGYIIKATVSGAIRAGIVALGSSNKGGIVQKCKVSKCGNSGISAVECAELKEVSGCTVTNNTRSGINLGHANIDIIANNVITKNTGHGISTNTEDNYGHKYCYIKKITGNKIENNGSNGVYIETNCRVENEFSGNVIQNNENNGVKIAHDAYIKGIKNNKFKQNKANNMQVDGKNAIAIIQGGNKFFNASLSNIHIVSKGLVKIKGDQNQISGAGRDGVNIDSKSNLVMSGKDNIIKNNGRYGIRVNAGSSMDIANVKFSGNKTYAVRVDKGCSVKYSNTNLSKSSTAQNRIYYVK